MATADEVTESLNAILAGATAASRESRTLDFKRQGRSRSDTAKDLAWAVACFANSVGGNVVVGVHDSVPGPAAFEGTDLDPVWLAQRVYELTKPGLAVSVDVRRVGDVAVLVLNVPRSPDLHQIDQRTPYRVGASCQPMGPSQIAVTLADRRGADWSGGETESAVTDVSPVALEQARGLLRQSPDPSRHGYASHTDADLLRVLGVVGIDGGLNRAGELLFASRADPPDELVYQYRRTPAGEPVVVQRLKAPLLPAVTRLLELVDARVDKTPVNLPGGQQVPLADLPEAAVREAVVNAVMHRDYRVGGPVQVEHAPTRLVVNSPGPFVFGVTIDNILTTTSRPRNPVLARAIRTLGLAEEAGVGVDRMYREMVRAGHQPPRFADGPDQVTVTLLGGAPNRHVARYVATLPQFEQDDADTMLVLYHLLSSRTISASQARALLQKDEVEAQEVLLRLSTEPVAMLEPTRETANRRHPNYRLRSTAVEALGPALRYHRRRTDEAERKVVELVKAAGQVNSRMVRVALDLDVTAASRLLAGLVEQGVLTRTSESRRGPSVTYGPGPAFPVRKRS